MQIQAQELFPAESLMAKKSSKIHDAITFSAAVEAWTYDRCMSYIDGLRTYCEQHGVDLESVKDLIVQSLKDKIEDEALKLNLLGRDQKKRLRF